MTPELAADSVLASTSATNPATKDTPTMGPNRPSITCGSTRAKGGGGKANHVSRSAPPKSDSQHNSMLPMGLQHAHSLCPIHHSPAAPHTFTASPSLLTPDSIQGSATCRCFSPRLSELHAHSSAAIEPVSAGTEDSRIALIGRLPPWLLLLWLLLVMPALLVFSAVPCSMLLMMSVVQGWKLKKDMPGGQQWERKGCVWGGGGGAA